MARQRPTRSGARNPLFQVALVTSESRVEGFTLGDLRVESCDVSLGTSRFDLTLSAARTSTHALELTAEYLDRTVRPVPRRVSAGRSADRAGDHGHGARHPAERASR
ncbi:hypothetical protein [Streptomyces sp. KL116D]|uniref:hypothetical protein n=1 Tax=Streptomyces sp. KL116D TaxID=3045152 RepID=UPI003556E39B